MLSRQDVVVPGGFVTPVRGCLPQVTMELESLTKRYPFQIPSYFALILRCFSVIEGIALRVDPNYSIVQECWPYLARRLLTDDHPRTRAALRQLLYGVSALSHNVPAGVHASCWCRTGLAALE